MYNVICFPVFTELARLCAQSIRGKISGPDFLYQLVLQLFSKAMSWCVNKLSHVCTDQRSTVKVSWAMLVILFRCGIYVYTCKKILGGLRFLSTMKFNVVPCYMLTLPHHYKCLAYPSRNSHWSTICNSLAKNRYLQPYTHFDSKDIIFKINIMRSGVISWSQGVLTIGSLSL